MCERVNDLTGQSSDEEEKLNQKKTAGEYIQEHTRTHIERWIDEMIVFFWLSSDNVRWEYYYYY